MNVTRDCRQIAFRASLAVVVGWSAATRAAAAEVTTDDGVRMTLAEDGSVTRLSVGEVELRMPRPGGFSVLDCQRQGAGRGAALERRDDAFRQVRGSLRHDEHGSRFQATMPEEGLSVEATIWAQGSSLRIDGAVCDSTGRDRAVALRFSLPWDATGWVWSHDTEERQPIEPGPVLRRTYKCQSGFGECSIYPWASVSGERTGVSLAIPIDQGPRVFLLQHDPTAHELSVTFFFGLCADVEHNRSRGPFSILLFRHDPVWGMRSTVERYQRLFPDVFAKRPPHEAYLNYGNLERFDSATHEIVVDGARFHDASDFGEGYVHLDHVHGCYQYMQTNLQDAAAPPDDAEVLHFLASPEGIAAVTARRYVPFEDFNKRIVFDSRGRIAYIGDTKFWAARQGYNQTDRAGWGLNFRVNEDPDISPYLAARAWDRAAEHTRSPGRRPWDAMLSADSIEGYFSNAQCLDHRREHFRSTLVPLTFATETREPALSNTIWDFLHKAWWPISTKGRLVICGNSNTYEQVFTARYTDIPLLENDWDVKHPGRLDRYVRAMYGKKLCRFWRAWDREGGYGEKDPMNVVRHFNRGLAYAIFPSVYGVKSAAGGLDDFRATYREYVPVMERLSSAGWQPVPFARATEGIVVERYGSFAEGDLYFTFRNYQDAQVDARVSFDLRGLGVPDGAQLVAAGILPAVADHAPVLEGRLPLAIGAECTVVIWLGTAELAAQQGFKLAGRTLQRLERTFAGDVTPHARALLTQARDVAARGAGAAAKDAPALATRFDEALIALQRGFKTAAPSDLAKLIFRARAEGCWACRAELGIESRTPRGPVQAVIGEAVVIPWRIRTSGGPIHIVTAQASTPWSEVSAVIRGPTQGEILVEHERWDRKVEIAIPAGFSRRLIPVLLTVAGRVGDQPFRICTPVDIESRPPLAGEVAPSEPAHERQKQ